ncbi:MAG: hypothetical protein EOO52_13360 [Gammaproteobacteria bacterium]|nr:MAG: hypothetical protein EOO52_13360 [Gammaproteobacteria bacterium]
MRNQVVVIHDPNLSSVHFCDTVLRGVDRWFAVGNDQESLFPCIEFLMVNAGIAHNVTAIDFLRSCGRTIEYTVIYNEAYGLKKELQRGDSVHIASENKTGTILKTDGLSLTVMCHDGEFVWTVGDVEEVVEYD